MYRAFRAVVKRHLLIQNGDSLLCGVSGGLDSMVLVSLLVSLKKDIPFDLCLAHVNYGLRGKESDAQENLAENFAKKHRLPFFSTRADLSRYKGDNFQKAARDFRYHYFTEVAVEAGANKVAVAHHLEDQVETILGHLLRGSSLRGLGGMFAARGLFQNEKSRIKNEKYGSKSKREQLLVRPLLSFSKETLRHYAGLNNLEYIEDSSNTSPKYWRNRLRQELLPVVKNLRPQSFGKIIRLGEELRELSGYLEEEAKAWLAIYAKKGEETFWIPRPALIVLPSLLRFEILRWAFVLWNGSASGLKKDHLYRCNQICSGSRTEGSYPLSQGTRFLRRGDGLLFQKVS